MKGHRALLDTVCRTVHLDSPAHHIVVLQLPPSTKHPSVHRTTAQNLHDISVAHEFLYVFPHDFHDMPLDRDVEFTIEL
jgi:hypothetical protein